MLVSFSAGSFGRVFVNPRQMRAVRQYTQGQTVIDFQGSYDGENKSYIVVNGELAEVVDKLNQALGE